MSTLLPDTLPEDPFPLFCRWFSEATEGRVQPNPNAMTLATIDADGTPSVRVVLAKRLVADPGYVVFFTNYRSRKGRAIESEPRVAGCLHWDTLGRQVRIEGFAVVSPEAESDAYFATRDPRSQLSAWASDQSAPLASREHLIAQTEQRARELGMACGDTAPHGNESGIRRPLHWGGYRIWVVAMELWIEGPARAHDRARWERTMTPTRPGHFRPGPWTAVRLQP